MVGPKANALAARVGASFQGTGDNDMRLAFPAFCTFAILTCAANAADPPKVDPDAIAALDKMGAYLRTLDSFQIKTDTLTDAVLDNGQKVQFAGNADYKVRRPS